MLLQPLNPRNLAKVLLEGKDYLEDTLIVIQALTIYPPSKDRYCLGIKEGYFRAEEKSSS